MVFDLYRRHAPNLDDVFYLYKNSSDERYRILILTDDYTFYDSFGRRALLPLIPKQYGFADVIYISHESYESVTTGIIHLPDDWGSPIGRYLRRDFVK